MECYPPGLQWYWRGDFIREIPDEAIEEHLKFAEQMPTLHSTMHLYPVDGAAGRVGRHETAFSYREAKWSMVARPRTLGHIPLTMATMVAGVPDCYDCRRAQ